MVFFQVKTMLMTYFEETISIHFLNGSYYAFVVPINIIIILVLYTIDLLTLKETHNNQSMAKLKKDDLSKLGHKN